LHARQYGFSVWFNAGSLSNIVQDANGTITSFVQPNSPTDFQSQINGAVLQNNDTGINVRWKQSDKLTVNLDYDHSQAWLNPGGQLSSLDADVGYGPSTPGGTHGTALGITVPGGHTLPYPTGYGPDGDAGAFLDPNLIGSHVLPIVSQRRFDRVQQAKGEMVWRQDENLKITLGYQYVGDHDNVRVYNDFANNQWQAYAGYGPASNNTGTHGVALPPSLFTGGFSTADFITGYGFLFQCTLTAAGSTYGNLDTSPGLIDANMTLRLDNVNGQVMTLPPGYSFEAPGFGVQGNFYSPTVAVNPAPRAAGFALRLAGANPSAGTTRLAFDLPRSGSARITVYDLSGRLVRSLASGSFEAGEHELEWDGRGESGERVATGLYFARAEYAGATSVQRIARTN